MTERHCVIFPHIPKCAGTSLQRQFSCADKRVFFDYDKPPSTMKFFAGECSRRNRDFGLLDFGEFDLVFGHFPLCRYTRGSYRYLALLRHPLQRAISQFLFWKHQLPDAKVKALAMDPVIAEIKAGRVGFTEFLVRQQVDSFYARYLGDAAPEQFLFVGFTEDYAHFCRRAAPLLGIELQAEIRAREGVKEALGEDELKAAAALLSGEIDRYQRFRDHWDRR